MGSEASYGVCRLSSRTLWSCVGTIRRCLWPCMAGPSQAMRSSAPRLSVASLHSPLIGKPQSQTPRPLQVMIAHQSGVCPAWMSLHTGSPYAVILSCRADACHSPATRGFLCRNALLSRAAQVCAGGSETTAGNLGARRSVREAAERGTAACRGAGCGKRRFLTSIYRLLVE